MPRFPGRRAVRARGTAPSKSGRFGRCKWSAMPREDESDARAAAEAVARRSYGKLISFLAARTRDVAGAEDALSDAFASALAGWPASGIPANPEAWLLTAARRKLIDAVRRRRTAEAGAIELQWLADEIDAASASG